MTVWRINEIIRQAATICKVNPVKLFELYYEVNRKGFATIEDILHLSAIGVPMQPLFNTAEKSYSRIVSKGGFLSHLEGIIFLNPKNNIDMATTEQKIEVFKAVYEALIKLNKEQQIQVIESVKILLEIA